MLEVKGRVFPSLAKFMYPFIIQGHDCTFLLENILHDNFAPCSFISLVDRMFSKNLSGLSSIRYT